MAVQTTRPALEGGDGSPYAYVAGRFYFDPNGAHPDIIYYLRQQGIPNGTLINGVWGWIWNLAGYGADVPEFAYDVYSDFMPTEPDPDLLIDFGRKLEAMFPDARQITRPAWDYSDRISKVANLTGIQQAIQNDPAAAVALDALTAAGGTVYVVGGAVRDAVLGKDPKDVDLMVTGLSGDDIVAVLQPLGPVNLTGKDFGVYRFRQGGSEVEIALPRTERSTGAGHRDFAVNADPNLPPEEDLYRRDFTVNAMGYDPLNNTLLDPFGGREDADQGRLRLVNPQAFEDDPLRIVRALVVNARHGLEPDDETLESLQTNAHRIRHLPGERVQLELDKLLGAPNPVRALEITAESGLLDFLAPELTATVGFDQRNPHHDLDVFSHTMKVLEAMARLSSDPDMRLAALFHDSGKPDSFWLDPNAPEGGGGHFYCIQPDAKVLMDDLTWKSADEVRVGDSIIAFDEFAVGKSRKWRIAKIVGASTKILPSCRITFSNGTTLVASENHMWLTGAKRDRRWQSTKTLTPGTEIIAPMEVWETEDSWDAGWLAGFLDGEGCISRTNLSFAQKEGDCLDRLEKLLADRGFDVYLWRDSTGRASAVQGRIRGGVTEQMRLLGTIRPIRLIANWTRLLDHKTNSDQARFMFGNNKRVLVESIVEVGDAQVIALGTTTNTLIVEGLASHNSHPDHPESADHEEVGADLVNQFMLRMRYPNERRERVVTLVRNHMFPYFNSTRGARKFLNRLGGDEQLARDLITLRMADASGKRDGTMNEYDAAQVETALNLLNEVLEGGEAFTIKNLAVDGHDLVALGLEGRQIGETLRRLLDIVIEEPSLNTKEQLLAIVQDST